MIEMQLPDESAIRLKLEVNPSGKYQFAYWMELCARLAQAFGDVRFTDVKKVKMVFTDLGDAQVAAQACLKQDDWQKIAYEAGMLVFKDHPEEIGREEAYRWLTSFFYVVLTQPEIAELRRSRKVAPRDLEGWAKMMGVNELYRFSEQPDRRADDGLTSVQYSTTVVYFSDRKTDDGGDEAEVLSETELPIPVGFSEN